MTPETLTVLLWLAFAFFTGCSAGYVARRMANAGMADQAGPLPVIPLSVVERAGTSAPGPRPGPDTAHDAQKATTPEPAPANP